MKPHWLAILNWLYHYPEIEINYDPPNVPRARWTCFWSSPSRREHMLKTLAVMGEETHVGRITKPAIEHLEGGTPKLNTSTFKALIKRGWVRPVKMRAPGQGLSGMYWWQLSDSGKAELMRHTFRRGCSTKSN